MSLTPADTETLRAFRRNAVHVRNALRVLQEQVSGTDGRSPVRVIDGYIQEDGWVERYRRVSTPVRRAAMDNDKASLRRTLAILERAASVEADGAIAEARRTFDQVQAELDSIVSLGGRKIARGEMFRAWMDAAVFYDSTDKQRPYEELVAAHGKAIESMAAQLTEDYAAAVIAVDEAAALTLGEPAILPPPERTPPPPPDPKEKGRWKKILATLFSRKTIDD
ncbi:MAG: hypothetical protein M3Q55_14625 [Acidobacteriota bacterium]|nr:hypothetical protein [Acidobacteriota bacterium]